MSFVGEGLVIEIASGWNWSQSRK